MKPAARRLLSITAAALCAVLALASCSEITHQPQGELPTYPQVSVQPDDSPSASPEPFPQPTQEQIPLVERVQVRVETLASNLDAPWGMAVLPDAAVVISLRDAAQLVVIAPDGTSLTVSGPGATALAASTNTRGEGGLLGIALEPEFTLGGFLYLYRTSTLNGEPVNQVLRAEFDGRSLGELELVLAGIPGATNHNGGALAFGPDGFLYVGTGDAAQRPMSQDPDSLAGKILRVTPTGEAAPNNPIPGSPVWSLGHRNVQGFDWDVNGRMFASEFGQNDADELNLIIPGENYGWPQVEGLAGPETGTRSPLHVWPPVQASPSGLAVTDEGIYLAGLRGQRLWRVTLGDLSAAPQVVLEGEGRLRNVLAQADDTLLVLTNNTDGRGNPGAADDRLLRLTVSPVSD